MKRYGNTPWVFFPSSNRNDYLNFLPCLGGTLLLSLPTLTNRGGIPLYTTRGLPQAVSLRGKC